MCDDICLGMRLPGKRLFLATVSLLSFEKLLDTLPRSSLS